MRGDQTSDVVEFVFPAKIVLAGEHAVLRGFGAVAIPHHEFSLKLKWRDSGVDSEPSCTPSRLKADFKVWEKLLYDAGEDVKFLGSIEVESRIPFSSGLGSSAALSAAAASLAHQLAGHTRNHSESERKAWILSWARRLEDRFHGTSSGMDVAAVLSSGPIHYFMDREPQQLAVRQALPRITLHDTGLRAKTQSCVRKVMEMNRHDLDQEMGASAEDVARAIESGDHDRLFAGVNRAQAVMEKWGLVPEQALSLIAGLRAKGARAVKLTGAGMGGFVIALW